MKRGRGGSAASRKESQREVAERRAAHFARADDEEEVIKKNHHDAQAPGTAFKSSTPAGAFVQRTQTVAGLAESWPGPFASAFEIIAKRKAANKLVRLLNFCTVLH
jgi:hypothetical protein